MVNLIANPHAEYAFQEGATLLEIVFPRVYSSDCIILRYGEEVMMIDSSTANPKMQNRIFTALNSMGVDHIDVAFNTHPHADHIAGFATVYGHTPFDKLLITYPEDFNKYMKEAMAFMRENHIPVETIADGAVLTMGGNGEVRLDIMQRWGNSAWGENDQSAMTLVTYGERTILLPADVENRAQKSYVENPPVCGLKADILKYPHHGLLALNNAFFYAVDPELAYLNGAADVMDNGKNYMEKKRVPYLLGYKGLTRMRTDGVIWVVDYLEEIGADR